MSDRKLKKGILSDALESCDRTQLMNIITVIGEFDNKAAFELMKLIKRTRKIYNDNLTSLQGAITIGNYNICKLLVEEGASMISLSVTVPHPLCLALQKGHFEIGRLLIGAGADVTLDFKESLPIRFALQNSSCNVPIIRDIIEAGFPPNGTVHYPSGRTSLHVAVTNNRTSVVKYLLSLSIDPNVKDKSGLSPLHYAVKKEYYSLVRLLVKNGANVDIECADHFTPLGCAITKESYDMVKLLIILGADLHYVNGDEACAMMPLHLAANFCNIKITELLLENGADVNKIVPSTGETVLHSACRAQHQKIKTNEELDCIVELLINQGADLEARHNSGMTPLQVAMRSENFSVGKILIMNGADINSFCNIGSICNAFHLASTSVDEDLIKLCLDYGGDYMAKDSDGMYPCGLALVKTFMNFVSDTPYNDPTSVFKLFWKHGLPYDATMKIEWLDYSPPIFPSKITSLMQKQKMLFRGVKNMQTKTVQKAIARGAEVKCCSKELLEPVHYIVCKGNSDILKEFVSRGTVLNHLNEIGETPILIAARLGHVKCCQLLLEHGATYNYVNTAKGVRSPLKIAKSNGHKDIVKILAKVDSYFKALKKGDLKKLRPNMKLFRAIMNCCHRDGDTLLGRAIRLDMKEVAEQLMMLRLKN